MDCIFCKIRDGEIPSAKVYEDEDVYAFLDITQATEGHTLIIPKKHVDDLFEYDEKLGSTVFSKIPLIARGLRQAFPQSKGLNMINNNGEVAYQTVFHSHIHLIPRYSTDDGFKMTMEDHSDSYSSEKLQDIALKISQTINTL